MILYYNTTTSTNDNNNDDEVNKKADADTATHLVIDSTKVQEIPSRRYSAVYGCPVGFNQ